jgi:hypothetical protein
MDFHSIEAGGLGVLGGFFESGDDAREFIIPQCARDDIRLFAFGSLDFIAGDRDGAGGHGLRALIEQGVASAPPMPDLEEDSASSGMHRISGFLPTGDLGL